MPTILNPPRPVIALIGRPNVGKSTLFNRLLGKRIAVVAPMHGTTRDRLYGTTMWHGRTWTFMDTGGMEFGAASSDTLARSVQHQLTRALSEADGVLFVCDAPQGLVPADLMIMTALRKTGKPIVLTVNKADHRLVVPSEFFSLGVEAPVPISALHGRGITALLDQLAERVKTRPSPAPGDLSSAPRHPTSPPRSELTVALLGRQNVGKSSFLNALLREERAIVHERPGTTRDLVEASLMVEGQSIHVLDTAGLRHRRKVRQAVDIFSMARTIEAIERCDAAGLVLDATIGVTRDDQRIASRVRDMGRGLALLVNKWDLVRGARADQLTQAIHRQLPAASFAPVISVSASTGLHVAQSLTMIVHIIQMMRQGPPEREWLTVLQRAWQNVPPGRFRGRVIHLQRARWIPGRPTRLELVTKPVGWLSPAYQRYLLKQFSQHPRLAGIPLHLRITT